MRQGDYLQITFFKEALFEVNASGLQLDFVYFNSLQFGIQ